MLVCEETTQKTESDSLEVHGFESARTDPRKQCKASRRRNSADMSSKRRHRLLCEVNGGVSSQYNISN